LWFYPSSKSPFSYVHGFSVDFKPDLQFFLFLLLCLTSTHSKNHSSEDLHPIAGIDRLIHEPALLMIMAYLYVARECRLPLPDAPDRAYGWQSLFAYEQA
jgi:hypothetical protein